MYPGTAGVLEANVRGTGASSAAQTASPGTGCRRTPTVRLRPERRQGRAPKLDSASINIPLRYSASASQHKRFRFAIVTAQNLHCTSSGQPHVVFREALFDPLESDKGRCALMPSKPRKKMANTTNSQGVGMGLRIACCIRSSLTHGEAKNRRFRKAQRRGTKPSARGSQLRGSIIRIR
ncbi:hypothetical protein GE21DRAFT_1033601 [Neurospora crassa]|nr:hypothetical protein GE21DRAFT_1033601 [Neurospora crassa]